MRKSARSSRLNKRNATARNEKGLKAQRSAAKTTIGASNARMKSTDGTNPLAHRARNNSSPTKDNPGVHMERPDYLSFGKPRSAQDRIAVTWA
jgi:hypothetical protein